MPCCYYQFYLGGVINSSVWTYFPYRADLFCTLLHLLMMYKEVFDRFHNKLLPSNFDTFFNSVLNIHNYNTRSAANQSYYLPRARTNYGIFNIRFQGPKVWNSLGKDMKSTPFSKLKIKNKKWIAVPILMPLWFLISLEKLVSSQLFLWFICCFKFDFSFIVFRISFLVYLFSSPWLVNFFGLFLFFFQLDMSACLYCICVCVIPTLKS